MLLDNVIVRDKADLEKIVRVMFDCTASGTECVSLSAMSEANVAIAMKIMEIANNPPSCHQETWGCILSVLRLLPWAIDPEQVFVTSQEAKVQAAYRYFGGMEFTELDEAFSTIREMIEEGKSWGHVCQYASQEMQVKL